MKKPKRPSATKYFFKGVFWTIFICMAAWIGFDMSDKVIPDAKGYTVAEREAVNELVMLTVGDLK